jgi:hypothetical protein
VKARTLRGSPLRLSNEVLKPPPGRPVGAPHRFAGVALLLVTSLLASCTGSAKPVVKKPAELKPQVQPAPIAGGTQIPDGPLINVFGPGPDGKMLPISQFPYAGLNADPTTIGNFNGFTALAYVAGEATGSDGKRYLLETDMRAFKGTYRGADGMDRTGVFAFI